MRHSDNSEAVGLIRTMRLADVTFLTDLWVASWREAMPGVDFEARRSWIAGILQHPAYRTLMAEGPHAALGFATFEMSHLHQLVVAPVAKGRGIARMLLDAVKAPAAGGLTLDVNQANLRAVRFYEREGFAREEAGINEASGLATWRMRWRRA